MGQYAPIQSSAQRQGRAFARILGNVQRKHPYRSDMACRDMAAKIVTERFGAKNYG